MKQLFAIVSEGNRRPFSVVIIAVPPAPLPFLRLYKYHFSSSSSFCCTLIIIIRFSLFPSLAGFLGISLDISLSFDFRLIFV